MQCFSPIHKLNPDFAHKPNQHKWLTFPCGKCPACVANKASHWYTRLLMQQRYSDNAVFVTLTYADENLPEPRIDDETGWFNIDVSKDDVRLYHCRLRKSLGPEKSKRLKYFLISEYGPNPTNGWLNRPHYHVIYFNLDRDDYDKVTKAWNKGFTEFGELTEGRIRYVSGYVIEKNFVPPGRLRPFTFISNGIGLPYVSKQGSFNSSVQRMYVPYHGKRLPMPRYYKDRLFSDSDKRLFSEVCNKRAQRTIENDLSRFDGDQQALEAYYHDMRSDFMRKQFQKHKKKKNG